MERCDAAVARELGVGVEAADRTDLGQEFRRGDRAAAGQLEQRWSCAGGSLFEFTVELDDRSGQRTAANDKLSSDAHLYLSRAAGEPTADPITVDWPTNLYLAQNRGPNPRQPRQLLPAGRFGVERILLIPIEGDKRRWLAGT